MVPHKQWFCYILVFLISLIVVLILLNNSVIVAMSQPSKNEVCVIVNEMQPLTTDEFLLLLKTNRQSIIKDLDLLKSNMEQYDAEGYGWQNVIDGNSSLEPQPGTWLIGALKIACEQP